MKPADLKLVIASLLIALVAFPAFSQEAADTQEQVQAPAPAAPDKEIAIYGEVQSVNVQSGVIAVQYYDYDSDSEKTADVEVASDAKIENAIAVSDIKKGDWVDVTYVVRDGKNAVKVVTVEKEEAPSTDEEAYKPAAAANTPSEQ